MKKAFILIAALTPFLPISLGGSSATANLVAAFGVMIAIVLGLRLSRNPLPDFGHVAVLTVLAILCWGIAVNLASHNSFMAVQWLIYLLLGVLTALVFELFNESVQKKLLIFITLLLVAVAAWTYLRHGRDLTLVRLIPPIIALACTLALQIIRLLPGKPMGKGSFTVISVVLFLPLLMIIIPYYQSESLRSRAQAYEQVNDLTEATTLYHQAQGGIVTNPSNFTDEARMLMGLESLIPGKSRFTDQARRLAAEAYRRDPANPQNRELMRQLAQAEKE